MATICSAIAASDAFRKRSEFCALPRYIFHCFLISLGELSKLSCIGVKSKRPILSLKSDRHEHFTFFNILSPFRLSNQIDKRNLGYIDKHIVPSVSNVRHMRTSIFDSVKCRGELIIVGLFYPATDQSYAAIGSNHKISPVVVLTNIKQLVVSKVKAGSVNNL